MSDENNSETGSDDAEISAPVSDLAKIKWYVWLLFIVVAVLNGLALRVYWDEDKLADYFDSKAFEGLLITLVVPLLLSLIAQIFKINEKRDEERKQRALEIKEKRRQLEDARRQRQTETIEKTNAIWSELYNLSTEVAYFKAGQSKSSIRDVRKKLECFINSAEEVVNLWHRNFSKDNVAQEVETLSLPALNLLLVSAATVADVIEDAANPNEVAEAKQLQNCLLVIQDGVKTGLHYPLLQIFYYAMENKTVELQAKITNLRGWGKIFHDLMIDDRPNLPPAAAAVSQKWDAYLADCKKNCAKPNQAEKSTQATLDDFYDAVSKCPGGLLGLSRKRILSPDQIEHFTREMFFYNEQMSIKNRL